MSIKQSAAFLVVMAALTLVGAGCLTTSPEPRQAPVAAPAATPVTTTQTDDETCPEGTARFSTVTSTPAFTFCHEAVGTSSDELIVTESDGIVMLYEKTNPTFIHTVRAFEIAPTDDVATAIAEQFMTEDNRAFCDVTEYEGPQGSQYVIAGGDLETQEKCGTFRAGFFLSNPASPYTLFYVEIGQDTFMPTDTWTKTLRPATK